MPHMPNELIHKIMESTHDDPYTLSQCMMVSWNFCQIVRPIFHSDLYLDLRGLRYDILPKLVRLFEVLDEVTRHVRILYLVLSDIDGLSRLLADITISALVDAGKLEEIYIKGRLDKLSPRFLLDLMELPSLQVISLDGTHQIPISLIQDRRGLRTLRLHNCTIVSPFKFRDRYSTDAEYNFAGDLVSDENSIIFPTSLTLELSKRMIGDIALLEKSANYLTSLTLVYYSHNPARYIPIAHITAESFPSLDTLSLVFHIGSTFGIPIDLPRFLQGHKRSSNVKHVNITFDHESCVFSDMKDYFSTTIKNAKAPFSTKEVFDRKALRCLESGSCKLLMTSEDLSVSRAADIGPFKADVQIKMNALFPTDELPWVNVKVVLEERFWEFIDF
ncbi:hypothetical protein CVT26_009700 [Gymnopilus dilepis]|uniref:F-box domain-containing protein n=1 Tax=Gymnopilus dilepis TaxID=231916 RepID=A0A409YBP0_9AGAR|nr:hypothetical protein CVT26_009700 [Gymnopilus dilepis]